MPKNQEKLIIQNQETLDLFAKLEQLSKEKPEVFAFFMSKFSTVVLDSYDWGALWRAEDRPVGMLDKFIPYIILIFQVVFGLLIYLKVK